MERYTNVLCNDVNTWQSVVQVVPTPFFRLARHLGSGENSDVYTIGSRDADVWRSEEDDGSSEEESSFDCSSDCTGCSQCESSSERDGDGNVDGDEDEDEDEDESKEEKGRNGNDSDDEGRSMLADSMIEERDHHSRQLSPEEMETFRLSRSAPWYGKTQIVVKVFQHLDDDTTFTIWDLEADTVAQPLKVFQRELECRDYMRHRGINVRGGFECRELGEGTALSPRNVGFSAFVNESLCHLLLTQLVVNEITPHVTIAFEALRHRNTGYLVMERVAPDTLDDFIYDACYGPSLGNGDGQSQDDDVNNNNSDRSCPSKEIIANLIFQTLFAMSVLQRTCNFKHHDLHANNVFIKKVDENLMFRNQFLRDFTHFHYHCDGADFYLPNCGYIVKIGDFGMASLDVTGKRLQRSDIDTFNDNVDKWGRWTSEFVHEEGYDTQLLTSDIPSTCHRACRSREKREEEEKESKQEQEEQEQGQGQSGKHKKKAKTNAAARAAQAKKEKKESQQLKQNTSLILKFVNRLQSEAAGGNTARVTRRKKRPVPGKVSTRTASTILHNMFNANASHLRNWYSFHTAPGVTDRVKTLGDTRWI